MKIAVVANLQKPFAHETAVAIAQRLKANGAAPLADAREQTLPDGLFEKLESGSLYAACDMIITVGGDGTILHVAKQAAKYRKPILGVNAGRVGYMASLERHELDRLRQLFSGEYTLQTRMMLRAAVVAGGGEQAVFYSLNDAVIAKGALSRMVDIELNIGEERLSFRADGIIAATPTGSTAYSMAAGGPILEPSLESIVVTPICPHAFTAKSFVLRPDARVRIQARGREDAKVFLTADGEGSFQLQPDAVVEITRAEDLSVQLIQLKGQSIYQTLCEKLR